MILNRIFLLFTLSICLVGHVHAEGVGVVVACLDYSTAYSSIKALA